MKMLYEELFLLCIHEEKMTFCPSSASSLNYFLGAAILSDLALQNRIQIKEDHRLYLLSAESTGDPLLDETLKKIQAVSNPKKVGYWMDDFEFKQKKFAAQLMEQLAVKGVLKHEDEDYSWVIPYPTDSLPPASAKYNLRSRLRSRLLTQEEPDLHEVALLSLMKACYMLEQVYFKDERKHAIRMINELAMTSALKDPIGQAVQEIESALTARVEGD